MPSEMIPCPHCGTENSSKKRICYNCENELLAPKTPNTPKKPSANNKPSASAKPFARQVGVKTNPKQGRRRPAPLISVKLEQRAQVYRQMYALLNAGMSLTPCLLHLKDNSPFHLKPVLRNMAEQVQAGGLLSNAMREYPSVFPTWESSVVMAAEKSGALPETMRDIADSIETEMDLRSRINAATFEMKITAVFFVLVMLIVSNVHAGSLDQVLGNLGTAVLKFSLLIACAIILINLWRYAARTRIGGTVISTLVARIPMIGPVLQTMARIRFVNVLGSLWHAGVSPYESLEVAAETTGDARLIYRVSDLLKEAGQGATLSSIIGRTKYLPSEAVYLIETGESSGDLSGSLKKVGEYHQIELDGMTKTLPTKLMVIMVLVMGTLVCMLAAKVYGGYFSSMLSIGGN